MRRVKNPQFLYHVSPRLNADIIKLKPRRISLSDPDEPDIKRICTSTSVAGCLSSVSGNILPRYKNRSKSTICVYRTIKRVRGFYPYNVCDSFITKERWLISPYVFISVCRIPIKIFYDIRDKWGGSYPCGSYGELDIQKELLIDIKSLLTFFDLDFNQKNYKKREMGCSR